MKYKPRNSNFAELQDWFAEEVIETCREPEPLERLKDYVAKTIDTYVDEIMEEMLANHHFICLPSTNPIISFCVGETTNSENVVTPFFKDTTLQEVLDDIEGEVVDTEDALPVAQMLETCAARLRKADEGDNS